MAAAKGTAARRLLFCMIPSLSRLRKADRKKRTLHHSPWWRVEDTNATDTIRKSGDGGATEACLTGGDRHRKRNHIICVVLGEAIRPRL